MKKLMVVLFVVLISFDAAFAQQETQVKKSTGPRRQLATIVFAGLGGAILGLSTLSFYGRPQEQLANIAIGFAVGVISGTAYVTFSTATTKDYYDDEEKKKNALLEEKNEKKILLSPMVVQSGGGASLSLNF